MIKIFEQFIAEPQINDYVIIKPKSKQLDWMKSKVGRIIRKNQIFVRGRNIMKNQYEVQYETSICNIYTGKPIWVFDSDEIIHFSKNKEELENINKYNV